MPTATLTAKAEDKPMPTISGRPSTGQAPATSAECKDPSIQACPPCCPETFGLDPALLALRPSSTPILLPSFAVQPVNGGTGHQTSTTTIVLTLGAMTAAGVVVWMLLRKRR